MIYIYSLFLYLLSPLLPIYLKYRGRKNPEYLVNWHERFGYKLKNTSSKPIIWLHSVSVGETRAMTKLVELLHDDKHQILITTMTPTGRKTAKNLFNTAIVHYIPYDLAWCVKNFYAAFKPELGIIMETEIWPNLVYHAHKNNIPLYLVNARLSDKSFKGYKRFGTILKPWLNKFSGILCQDQDTSEKFKKLGYSGQTLVVGNTKFDLSLPDNFTVVLENFNKMRDVRKIICFASTREGEEELILKAVDFSLDVVYLIIPRHPERFIALENLLKQKQLPYIKRSENKKIAANEKIIIGDSMGEMLAYYAISYLVVMGGSLKDFGGQNIIEPLYVNVPVIFGKSMYNFDKIAKDALELKCAVQIDKVDEVGPLIKKLTEDQLFYEQLKNNSPQFIDKYQGASRKIFSVIKKHL